MSYASTKAIEQHLAADFPDLGEVEIPTPIERPPLPAELCSCPGLVGDIAAWIDSTSRYPQPVLSLGAAITVVGTAAGRRVVGPTQSGTHLYILALAPTGAGKNHPPKMAAKLMRAAGMSKHIGPGQFMSMSAVFDVVARQPLLACFQDEFGALLARVNANGASGHEKAISGVLRTLWGASCESVMPPAWAASSSREVPKAIHWPSLSIYGSSVPDEFYSALTSSDVMNGFLNRFLLLGSDEKPGEVEPTCDSFDVPTDLADQVKALAGGSTCGSDGLHSQQIERPEFEVDWASADVRLAAKSFRLGLEAREGEAAFLTRTYEMAIRLATIRAIGCGTRRPVIDAAGWEWAHRIALWSAERMIADAAEHMAEGEHQRQVRHVERLIRDAGRITRTDLYRKVDGRYTSRVLGDILTGLEEAGIIRSGRLPQPAGKRGPPALAYAYSRETIR